MEPSPGIAIGVGALIGGLVWTLTAFIRRISAKDWRGVKNQGLTYAVGVIVMLLVSSADLTERFAFNGKSVGDLNFASLIILGLMVTSLFAMVPYDFKKAIDRSDSAVVPDLGGAPVAPLGNPPRPSA